MWIVQYISNDKKTKIELSTPMGLMDAHRKIAQMLGLEFDEKTNKDTVSDSGSMLMQPVEDDFELDLKYRE